MALLASSMVLAAVLINTGKSNRIVVGQAVTADEYPFIVSVGGYCDGSLLRKEKQAVVLTAADCIFSSDITVTFDGDYIDDPNGIKKQVSSVVVNPNYNPSTGDNDIALLFIDEDLNEYEQLKTVTINPLSSDASECCSTGDDLTLIGYGADYEEGQATLTLQYVDIDYLSQAECQNNDTNRYPNGEITNSMLCAETLDKDSCQGDSGGPLIKKGTNYEQVGIVSWGWGCARYPGVYTNIGIPSIYNWIETTINNEKARFIDIGISSFVDFVDYVTRFRLVNQDAIQALEDFLEWYYNADSEEIDEWISNQNSEEINDERSRWIMRERSTINEVNSPIQMVEDVLDEELDAFMEILNNFMDELANMEGQDMEELVNQDAFLNLQHILESISNQDSEEINDENSGSRLIMRARSTINNIESRTQILPDLLDEQLDTFMEILNMLMDALVNMEELESNN